VASCIRYERKEFLNTVRGISPGFERMRTHRRARRFIDPWTCRRGGASASGVLATDLLSRGPWPASSSRACLHRGRHHEINHNGQRDERCAIPGPPLRPLREQVSNIIYRPLTWATATTRAIKEYLSKLIGFDPSTPIIGVWDTMEAEKSFRVFFAAFNASWASSAVPSVGGVGVASIMMVVSSSGRAESGSLAVGARRQTIWRSESLFLMLFGGFIGFALSAGVIRLAESARAASFTDFVGLPQLSPLVAFSTIGILLVIGTISGFIPARRAASTDPIAALRK
jgi:putative ABC transport system permease protein